jgi:hypothetical protein
VSPVQVEAALAGDGEMEEPQSGPSQKLPSPLSPEKQTQLITGVPPPVFTVHLDGFKSITLYDVNGRHTLSSSENVVEDLKTSTYRKPSCVNGANTDSGMM